MASSSSAAASTPPPPPPLPEAKKTFLRRLVPIFLASNVLVAIYIFVKTSRKQSSEKEEEPAAEIPFAPAASKDATTPEKKLSAESIAPVKVNALPPIPEHEQRELFKWMLEEKRKIKPRDPSEKKKIDEEKAFLKQLIRGESIPSL